MDTVFQDTRYKSNVAYVDDTITFSPTFEQHVIDIERTLSLLKQANLTIHPRKVQLCRQELKFLGYVIKPGKCMPNPKL